MKIDYDDPDPDPDPDNDPDYDPDADPVPDYDDPDADHRLLRGRGLKRWRLKPCLKTFPTASLFLRPQYHWLISLVIFLQYHNITISLVNFVQYHTFTISVVGYSTISQYQWS